MKIHKNTGPFVKLLNLKLHCGDRRFRSVVCRILHTKFDLNTLFYGFWTTFIFHVCHVWTN